MATEFTLAVASPLPLECELRMLGSVTGTPGLTSGLSVYDDGAGGARIIYAADLTNDESQEVEQALALHAVSSPLLNYVELFSAADTYPGLRAAGPDSIIHLFIETKGSVGVIRTRSIYFLMRSPSNEDAVRFQLNEGTTDGFAFETPVVAGQPLVIGVLPGVNNAGINIVPDGTGRLQVNAVNVPTISSTDTITNKSITSDQINLPSLAAPSTYLVSEDFTARGSSGVKDGTITYVGVGTTAVKISVAAGEGYIRTTNDQQGNLIECSWAQSVDLYTFSAPAAGQENTIFIGIEYNGGAVTAVAKTAFTDFNWYTNFPLARCSYDGTTMRILNMYAHSEDTANLARKMLRLTMPFAREEAPEGTGGLELSVSLLALSMSGGKFWHGFNNYTIAAINSPATFDTHYRRAGGGFNSTIGVTSYPATQYDDGSGTLATMTAGRYGTLWVYLDIADGSLDVMYGAVNATSVALAQADTQPGVPAHLTYHGKLIGRIIYKKSDPSPTLVESAWSNVFASGTGGGSPGGNNTEVQYNNSGSFSGITGATTNGTALTLVAPVLGTPSSGVLTNCTGLPTAGLVDAAVTYAKMQNVSATDKVLGRATAGAGNVEEIACTAAGRALLDDASAAAQVTTLGLDNTKIATITFIIDGSGSAITTGVKGDLEIPFACTITQATLLANESGSIVVDIFKSTYAAFDPPTTPASGNKITASAPPTISSAKKSQDSTLTGWTTSISAGDVLRVNVNSATTITRCTLSLRVTKT